MRTRLVLCVSTALFLAVRGAAAEDKGGGIFRGGCGGCGGEQHHRVGNRKLNFDAEKERFVDDREANRLLKRRYRKPYEIPETV